MQSFRLSRQIKYCLYLLLAIGLSLVNIKVFSQTESAPVTEGIQPDEKQDNQSKEYKEGIKAFASEDYKKAATLWLTDSYRGAANAQFNIGVMYVEGKGFNKNRGEAMFWFLRAAKQGHPAAQYNLGHLLLEEKDDLGKIKEGIDWWEKSAENGFSIAQFNYGRALFYGIGATENRPLSRHWLERAANAGNQRAIKFVEDHKDEFIRSNPEPAIAQAGSVNSAAAAVDQQPKLSLEVAAKSDYVLVKDLPILMYSRFNTLSPVVTRVDAKVLLRVVSRKRDWLLVEVPGGVSGWIRAENTRIDKDLVLVTGELAKVYADPTERTDSNEIGKLRKNTKILLLEQEQDWVRVLLPEMIPGWIEVEGVDKVKAAPSEIISVWQNQRMRRKREALSARKVKLSAIPSGTTTTDSIESKVTLEAAKESMTLSDPDTILVASNEPANQVGIVIESISELVIPTSWDIESPNKARSSSQEQPNSNQIIASQPHVTTNEAEPRIVEQVAKANPGLRKRDQILASGIIGSSGDANVSGSETIFNSAISGKTKTSLESSKLQIELAEPASQAMQSQTIASNGVYSVAQEVNTQVTNYETIYRTKTGNSIVRSAPSNSASKILELPLNTLVDIVSDRIGYSEVIIPGGLPVWIAKDDGQVKEERVLILGDRVRAKVDSDDSTDSALGLLPNGSLLPLVERKGDWLRVVAPEWITGWVLRRELVKPDELQGLEQVWQRHAKRLLTGYLGEQISELALVIGLDDSSLFGSGITNDNDWLFEPGSRKYTLQLFSMANVSSAQSLYKSLRGRGQFYSTIVGGQRWYFVLLGKFLTSEAAKAVGSKLPPWASDSRVRSVARLQVNRCNKIGEFNQEEARNLDNLCR